MQFLVRTNGDPAPMVQTVRREIRAAEANDVVLTVFTLDQVIFTGAREILASTYPLVPLIATGILLTAAGIYGVLAFAITRRSNELAVRLAIGATRTDLVRLVAGHSLRLLLAGIVLGVGATFWLTRIAQGSGGVFDSPGWQAFAVPVSTIVLIGALATWIPALRVLRINPAVLLRTT